MKINIPCPRESVRRWRDWCLYQRKGHCLLKGYWRKIYWAAISIYVIKSNLTLIIWSSIFLLSCWTPWIRSSIKAAVDWATYSKVPQHWSSQLGQFWPKVARYESSPAENVIYLIYVHPQWGITSAEFEKKVILQKPTQVMINETEMNVLFLNWLEFCLDRNWTSLQRISSYTYEGALFTCRKN